MIFKLSTDEIKHVLDVQWYGINGNYVKKPTCNMSHLVYLLLHGRDVFSHYSKKKPDAYLVNVLQGGPITAIHPYQSIIAACREYLCIVPDNIKVNKPTYWSSIQYRIARMNKLSELFGLNYHSMINLRPYIYNLLLKVLDINKE